MSQEEVYFDLDEEEAEEEWEDEEFEGILQLVSLFIDGDLTDEIAFEVQRNVWKMGLIAYRSYLAGFLKAQFGLDDYYLKSTWGLANFNKLPEC